MTKRKPGRPKKPDRKVPYATRIRPDQAVLLRNIIGNAAKFIEDAIDMLARVRRIK
jgi:hypothetical protein